jgi:hypothetical protein
MKLDLFEKYNPKIVEINNIKKVLVRKKSMKLIKSFFLKINIAI